MVGEPHIYDETNKNNMIEAEKWVERFNQKKYRYLAQEFKFNIGNFIRLECLGLSKLELEASEFGLNI